jgi:ribonuclease BN (tRNA processing enzyme)
MKVIFLGTGEAYSPSRNDVQILIEDKNSLLLECGFTGPKTLWRYNSDKNFIDHIFISHFHGDHAAGLPLLCMKLRQEKRTKPLTIIGPIGIKRYFERLFEIVYRGFVSKLSFPIIFLEAIPGNHLDVGYFKLKFAYGKHLTGETEVPVVAVLVECNGRRLCYSGDTIFRNEIVDLAKHSDILIHESYVSAKSAYHAMRAHCSPLEAGRVAKLSNSKKLALVHLRRDYVKNKGNVIKESSEEFRGEIIIPDDGDVIII